MGFLTKLKQNFNHGGIKVTISAPNIVSESDPSFSTILSILNTSEIVMTVNSIHVTLEEDRIQAQPNSNQNSAVDSQNQIKEISRTDDLNMFTIEPKETKQMTIIVPLNFGKLAQGVLPENGALNAIAGVLGNMQKVMNVIDESDYIHYVNAVVDVDGISFDPSARVTIKVLKPGQYSASLKFGS